MEMVGTVVFLIEEALQNPEYAHMFVPIIATIVPLMFYVMLMGLLSSIAIGEQERDPEPMQEEEVETKGHWETWKSWIGFRGTKPQTNEKEPTATLSKEQQTAEDKMAENRRWLEEDHPIGCDAAYLPHYQATKDVAASGE